MGFWIEVIREILYLLFLKFINFKILELFINYIKKVWYKFWNWIIRNIIFIVVIKVDSCKKINEVFVFILLCWEEECIICKNFVWICICKIWYKWMWLN